MFQTGSRLTTPVELDDAQLARVKLGADRDLQVIAHAMQRFAAVCPAYRIADKPDESGPSTVGCDEHSAAVARAVVERALNLEAPHKDRASAPAVSAAQLRDDAAADRPYKRSRRAGWLSRVLAE